MFVLMTSHLHSTNFKEDGILSGWTATATTTTKNNNNKRLLKEEFFTFSFYSLFSGDFLKENCKTKKKKILSLFFLIKHIENGIKFWKVYIKYIFCLKNLCYKMVRYFEAKEKVSFISMNFTLLYTKKALEHGYII